MALTFSDWTHYTDDGGTARTLDWTDPAGCVTRAHGEAVRQAIVERCAVTGDTVPAVLSAALEQHAPTLYTWAAAVQDILSLWVPNDPLRFTPWAPTRYQFGEPIPSFHNIDAVVAMNGKYHPMPRWGMGSMLNQLAYVHGYTPGTYLRLAPSQHTPMLGAWIQQQAWMLAELRWLVVEGDYIRTDFTLVGNPQKRYGDVWSSTSWSSGYAPYVYHHVGSAYEPKYSPHMSRQSIDVGWTPTFPVRSLADVYGVLNGGFEISNTGFYAEDVGVDNENSACLFQTDIDSDATPTVLTVGKLDIAPIGKYLWNPRTGWQCGFSTPSTQKGAYMAMVVRFDVTGGFTFQES